jgi:hypothetical protein
VTTQRKAEITKDQLQRRYATLNGQYSPETDQLNLLKVVRWFNKQDESVKRSIAESEPAPWLQHLHGRSDNAQAQQRHSLWNLTALILDKYKEASDPRFTFPVSLNDRASDSSSSISGSRVQASDRRPFSSLSMEQMSTSKKSDDISFEPIVQSRRSSVAESSRGSVDVQQPRLWRYSLGAREEPDATSRQNVGRTRRQTITSQEQASAHSGRSSPSGKRRSLQAFGVKKKKSNHQSPLNSDDGRSSAGDINEASRKRQPSDSRPSRFHLSLDLKSSPNSVDDEKNAPVPFTLADFRTDAFPKKSRTAPPQPEASASTENLDPFNAKSQQLESPIRLKTPFKTARTPLKQLSVPPRFQTPSAKNGRRRTEAQEHALHVEYTRKRECVSKCTLPF